MTEYRRFVIPPTHPLTLGTALGRGDVPSFTSVTIPMPAWATDEMIHNVIRAIERWRYAHTNPTELAVYVPITWLTTAERRMGHGGPSTILGVPLRYTNVAQLLVGVVASGE